MRPLPALAAWIVLCLCSETFAQDEGTESAQALWKALEAREREVQQREAQVSTQFETVERMLKDREYVGIHLEITESLLAIRSRQSEVVKAQLTKQIQSWEAAAARSPDLQRRISTYQRYIDTADKDYDRSADVKTLTASQTKHLNTRSQIHLALRQSMENLRQAKAASNQAGIALVELRRAFATAKLAAMNEASEAAPPYLERIRILGSRNRPVYAASWKSLDNDQAQQVARLHQLLDAQLELLGKRELHVNRWSELAQMRNAECQQILAESEDALWRQFWTVPAAEMSTSVRDITWTSGLPDSLAILFESGDRLLLQAIDHSAWSYQTPGSIGSHGILSPEITAGLAAIDWSSAREAIAAASRGLDRGDIYGDAGLDGLANIWVTAAMVPSSVATESLLVEATATEVNETWLAMVNQIDRSMIELANERLPSLDLPDPTRQAWKDFAKADARRMAAVASFQATAALEWVDRHILYLLLDELDRVTSRGPIDSLDRLLVRETDDPLQQRRDYQVELSFSRADVVVSAVSLGGLPVAATPTESNDATLWTGEIRFESTPLNGQLSVTAEGLDDPATSATLDPIGENWLGYEQGPDLNHRLRTGKIPERSFVIIFDPGADLSGAVSTAANVFQERKFQSGDELALYLANESGVVRAAAFTQNHTQVWKAIEAATAQDSALPAWSVVTAGRYLYNQGRGEEKNLILLSSQPVEGLEAALVSVREMRQLITTAQP